MNTDTRVARRYHWHSPAVSSFTEQPHSFIYGRNQGEILNLTDKSATATKQGILQLTKEDPKYLLAEIPALIMPSHHDVREKDVNIKRLGATLALAHEKMYWIWNRYCCSKGRAAHGSVFDISQRSDTWYAFAFQRPGALSFAHGGKDGHPFPVPEKVYDETIAVLETSLQKAKLGNNDKAEALKKLHLSAKHIEKDFVPNNKFNELIEEERNNSWKYGGRTVYGRAVKTGKYGNTIKPL